MNEITRLWRKGDDGVVRLVEVRRSAFPSTDAYMEALDFHYARGCFDSYAEAQAA